MRKKEIGGEGEEKHKQIDESVNKMR